MRKYSLKIQEEELDEITLNKHGDKIFISPKDANLWTKFLNGYNKFSELADETKRKLSEAENKCKEDDSFSSDPDALAAILRMRIDFCEKAIEIIDGVFGAGTIKKSFRDEYEAIPDFVPDEDRLSAFFETMTPIMGEIFKLSVEDMEKASKARMKKYEPKKRSVQTK